MKAGEKRLREVIQKQNQGARREDPMPYDNDWGWWVEARLERLENAQLWLIRIAAGALAAEIVRITLQAMGLAP